MNDRLIMSYSKQQRRRLCVWLYIYIYMRDGKTEMTVKEGYYRAFSLSNSLRCRDTRTPINMKKALKQNKVEE